MNILQTIETKFEVGMTDLIDFLRNDLLPDVIAVFKDVVKADMEVLVPIAANAVQELAAEASNLTNPAMLGQALASILAEHAQQAGKAVTATTVSTAALALAAALQAAQTTVTVTPAP